LQAARSDLCGLLKEEIGVFRMHNITRDDAIRMVQALHKLHDMVGRFLDGYAHRPSPNSQASIELNTFQRPESVVSAYSQGGILIDAAADQLMAFTKTVSEPAQTIAPWTCVRAVIESSALASWLLDPSLDARTRVQRSLAFRYEGLDQQFKFLQAIGNNSMASSVLDRITRAEGVALELGFPKLVDKKGKRIGIGLPMPSSTEIIKTTLNEEGVYRILSAAIHGHLWALQQLSYRRMDEASIRLGGNNKTSAEVHLFEKHLEPFQVVFLCLKASNAFTKAVWYMCQVFGWDLVGLGNILDTAFDIMRVGDDNRFWRNQKT
jgi:hypothetical protein